MGPSSTFRFVFVYVRVHNRSVEARYILWVILQALFTFSLMSLIGLGSPQRDKADCQSIPRILLSPPPKYWNYYQVTMYSLDGFWGSRSGPDVCQASTLLDELSPQSQVQMILMNKKFKKNDSLVCFLFFFFFCTKDLTLKK